MGEDGVSLFIGLLCLLVSVGCGVFAVHYLLGIRRFLATTIETTGFITLVQERSYAKFRLRGESFEVQANVEKEPSPYVTGQPVRILVPLKAPERARFRDDLYSRPLLFGILAGAFLTVASLCMGIGYLG